jgi:hypothetical protein
MFFDLTTIDNHNNSDVHWTREFKIDTESDALINAQDVWAFETISQLLREVCLFVVFSVVLLMLMLMLICV